MRTLLCLLATALCALPAFAAEVTRLPVEKDGWNGADASYNRLLPDGNRLWVFGDTLVGKTDGKTREPFKMYRNTVGIQKPDGSVHYYLGKDYAGVFVNPRPEEWYWPADFALVKGRAYFFMRRLKLTKEGDPLGFAVTGTDVAVVKDISQPPEQWEIAYASLRDNGQAIGIAAAPHDDGYLYLLTSGNDKTHGLYLARMAQLAMKDQILVLTYYDPRRKEWRGSEPVRPILPQGSPEASLSWDEAAQEWRLIYTPNGFDRAIVERTAKTLTGEWSEPKTLYSCPEMGEAHPNYVCYAGKAVQDSTPPQITYSVNSLKPEELNKDADLYIPRIVTP